MTITQGIFAVIATAACAVAQTVAVSGTLTQTIPAPAGVAGGVMGGFGGSFAGGGPLAQVTGQPFSAQQETQTIQTLADGTRITNGVQKVTYYRDSLGRTRTERTAMQPPGFMGSGASAPPVFIEIADPVAGYRYSLDSNSHTAHRAPFGPVRPTNAKVVAPPGPAIQIQKSTGVATTSRPYEGPGPEISREQLGTQTIEGVLAEGTRATTTYPVGFFGNDRPISTVSETWFSGDLRMAVLSKTSDPRYGETTTKLTNISRAEPAPSLFQPPAGYEIVDPAGQPAQK